MSEQSSTTGGQLSGAGATGGSAPPAVPVHPAYPVAAPHQIAAALPHKTARARNIPWLLLGLAALVGVVVGGILAVVLTPALSPACNLHCPQPPPPRNPLGGAQLVNPTGLLGRSAASGPLVSGTRYTSSAYGFSLDEYPDILPPPTKTTDKYVLWNLKLKSGPLEAIFTATHANGQGAQQIATNAVQSIDQNAHLAYEIPGAELGYTPGYGAVYDVTVSPATGPTLHLRLIVEAAEQGNLAVVTAGFSPYAADKSEHPSPASTLVVALIDPVGNSVTWPGEKQL